MSIRFRPTALLAIGILAACDNDVPPTASAPPARNVQTSAQERCKGHYPALCYTDQELVDAVAASGGRVFIGIAAPEFPRAAQAARERRLPRWADAEWGARVLEVKNARVQVQEEFRSLSVVAARIDPVDAPRLRRLPHTWYVEPQFARYIRRPDAPEGPRMMACPMYVSDCNSPTEPTDPIDPPTDPDPRGTTSVTEAYADLRTTQLVGWNVVNPGIASQYGGPWTHNYKGQNMKVGIIDGEVMITHPKLSANLIERRNYTSQAFGSPDGHATWVAGAVVAPESGYGTVGAAPQAKYYNAKVCAGSGCSTTGILNAVDWLSSAGAHVINMSLGGGGCSVTERNRLQQAVDRGSLIVVAAGEGYPIREDHTAYGCYDLDLDGIPGIRGLVSVSAHTKDVEPTTYSWYSIYRFGFQPRSGPTIGGPGGEDFDDLLDDLPYSTFVPGQVLTSHCADYTGDGYGPCEGTSMAAPIVSAIGLLVKQRYSYMTPGDIEDHMINDAVVEAWPCALRQPCGGRSPGYGAYGYGRAGVNNMFWN